MLIECPRCSGWVSPGEPACPYCGSPIGVVYSRREIRQYPPSPTLLSELWLPALLAGLLLLWIWARG